MSDTEKPTVSVPEGGTPVEAAPPPPTPTDAEKLAALTAAVESLTLTILMGGF